MTNKKLETLKQIIETAQASINAAHQLISELTGGEKKAPRKATAFKGKVEETAEGKIIEGTFDGQNMIGPDGKQYSVPANYASKSKLVEGDVLKLTITADGSFIYKQIGPIERDRLVGILTQEETTSEYRVLAADRTYQVLTASITYFKGEPGDEVVILVPKDRTSTWAAVENIIKKIAADEPPDKAAETTDDLDKI